MVSMDAKMGLAIGLMINVFLFLSQVSVAQINPSGNPEYFNYKDSQLQQFDQGNYSLDQDYQQDIQGQDTTSPDQGNVFTNAINTVKNWITETTGLKYLGMFVNAFPNAIESAGLPKEITFALSSLWYGFAVFSVVLVWFGRN